MKQITLKRLEFHFDGSQVLPFTYPEAMDCLKNLSELRCYSNICSEVFYQISQICHNLQSLNITMKYVVSDGLADLISIQQSLKYLSITGTGSFNSKTS